ncbi:unnamed protein product [Vitrella brassicaformis CCMP3155]|uniref:Glycosyltransferase 2-like domain-containing protein n=2 Tax=Vitrella brassicaformis TaxID=1169539 RepID=A0A0G4EGR8_VITBC|nr:unnamed protein product [Vitrella brassicaformis CCMP3155]|eukprot:CEL95442.1 unnamed protein product [Vitrella brassicaformis CCMP3155]
MVFGSFVCAALWVLGLSTGHWQGVEVSVIDPQTLQINPPLSVTLSLSEVYISAAPKMVTAYSTWGNVRRDITLRLCNSRKGCTLQAIHKKHCTPSSLPESPIVSCRLLQRTLALSWVVAYALLGAICATLLAAVLLMLPLDCIKADMRQTGERGCSYQTLHMTIFTLYTASSVCSLTALALYGQTSSLWELINFHLIDPQRLLIPIGLVQATLFDWSVLGPSFFLCSLTSLGSTLLPIILHRITEETGGAHNTSPHNEEAQLPQGGMGVPGDDADPDESFSAITRAVESDTCIWRQGRGERGGGDEGTVSITSPLLGGTDESRGMFSVSKWHGWTTYVFGIVTLLVCVGASVVFLLKTVENTCAKRTCLTNSADWTLWQKIATYGTILSMDPLIPVFVQVFVGMFWPYGLVEELQFDPDRIKNRLFAFRVVTRGNDPVLINETLRKNTSLLLCHPDLQWIVEAVTQRQLGLALQTGVRPEAVDRIYEIYVPEDYRTPRGTLYKARNLQYALEGRHSVLNNDDFIIHLDEETLLDHSSILGIKAFFAQYPDRIGSGRIVYGHGPVVNLLTTCIDSVRLSEDHCRTRFWQSLGLPSQGLKGSFFAVRKGVEEHVTFDVGAAVSICEDAYFGLKAQMLGYKFGWIRGTMREFSPFTFMDLAKQRRRWIQGHWKIIWSSELSWGVRWPLLLAFLIWSSVPFTAFLCTIFKLAGRGSQSDTVPYSPALLWIAGLSYGASMACYFFGSCQNFSIRSRGLFVYLVLVLGTTIGLPLVTFWESFVMLYSLATRDKGFHVVQKTLQNGAQPPPSQRTPKDEDDPTAALTKASTCASDETQPQRGGS